MAQNHNFSVSTEVDSRTGEVLAVYFTFRKGRSAQVVELGDGAALADYDRAGNLLGLELLGPCKLKVLTRIKGSEPETRKFIKNLAPREMVMA